MKTNYFLILQWFYKAQTVTPLFLFEAIGAKRKSSRKRKTPMRLRARDCRFLKKAPQKLFCRLRCEHTFKHQFICHPKPTTRCLAEEWDAWHYVRTNNRALTFCPRGLPRKHQFITQFLLSTQKRLSHRQPFDFIILVPQFVLRRKRRLPRRGRGNG